MSFEHTVLQKIGCYGRVNIGNFEPHLLECVYALYERGEVFLVDDHNNVTWVILTQLGKDSLIVYNNSIADDNLMMPCENI